MDKKSVVKTGLGALVGVGVLIQFVPVQRTNPPVVREVRWTSEATRAQARSSCYDCHSNETVWPWYSYVAPASWLVAKDVNEGREHLNFSRWDQPNEDLEEITEMIEDGEMPLKKYLALHGEARMDEAGRSAFLRGLTATFEADPPVPEDDDHDDGDDDHDEGGDDHDDGGGDDGRADGG
jgi:Haem-binding domain